MQAATPHDSTLSAQTRKAIEAGIDLLRTEGYQVSFPESLNSILWRLLQEAADTLKRCPDKERRFLMAGDRIAWPDVIHSAQEHFEAELQRLVDVKMSKEQARLPRLPITDPSAEPRMLTVLSWLRYMRPTKLEITHVLSKASVRFHRERRALLAWAGGAKLETVRHLMQARSEAAPYMMRQRALRNIGQGVLTACNGEVVEVF